MSAFQISSAALRWARLHFAGKCSTAPFTNRKRWRVTEMADQGLVRETACAVVGKLRSGEVTPLDLLDVLEQRIAEVDGPVNALPTLCFDRARTHARALMKKPA